MCDYCVQTITGTSLEMHVKSGVGTIQFICASFETSGNISKIKFAGINDGIKDGKVTDSAKCLCSGLFDHAIPLFGAELTMRILCNEVSRFFRAGKFEDCEIPVMIPIDWRVGNANRVPSVTFPLINFDSKIASNMIVWYCSDLPPHNIKFIIATRDVFGLVKWVRVTVINCVGRGYNSADSGEIEMYLSLHEINKREWDDPWDHLTIILILPML